MKIYVDVAQKDGKHNVKHRYLEREGYELVFLPLPEGDYVLENEKIEGMLADKAKRSCKVTKNDISGLFNVSVDTKRDIQEIIGNICGKAHMRFHDECVRAQNKGIKFYVLIENKDGVKEVRDLFKWQNPRLHRYNKIVYMHAKGLWLSTKLPKAKPTSGSTLAKAMLTMQLKYGVEFVFCHPKDTGQKIIELLTEK